MLESGDTDIHSVERDNSMLPVPAMTGDGCSHYCSCCTAMFAKVIARLLMYLSAAVELHARPLSSPVAFQH